MKKNKIKISTLSDDELHAVAKIHIESIRLGFLSQLGPNFLFFLYKSIHECPETELLIVKDNDLTVGFISGCTSLRPVLKHLIMKYLIQTIISLIPQMIKPSNIKRIYEILTYSSKKNDTPATPTAELLSLAVLDSYRGSGAAKELFGALKNQFKLRGFSEFKIIVGEELIQAQKFYEKMGATKMETICLHGDSLSFIYRSSTD